MAETTHVVQLDSRGRLSLGRYATSELYVVYVYDSGRIVLEPASVVSALDQHHKTCPKTNGVLECSCECHGPVVHSKSEVQEAERKVSNEPE